MCFVTSVRYFSSSGFSFQQKNTSFIVPLIISLIFVFWLGDRPVSGIYFGDTSSYAHSYENDLLGGGKFGLNIEWFWNLIGILCKKVGFSVHVYFIIIEAIYILSVLWAVRLFVPSNPMLGMLFVFSSLMFFAFGTNGLRNGMACHLTLLSLAFFLDEKKLPAAILALLAFGTHRSVFLPIMGVLAARYFLRDFKLSLILWVVCIPVSLIAGGFFSNVFASLGFDDRMTNYLLNHNNDHFSHTGFRWDLLLYSIPPVLLGWYVLIKLQIKDDWFRILCITYCLCNAFWILVIRVTFTNRFAYLSWFLYPIIFAYALINIPIWQDQDKKIGIILFAYAFFTVFMNIFIW